MLPCSHKMQNAFSSPYLMKLCINWYSSLTILSATKYLMMMLMHSVVLILIQGGVAPFSRSIEAGETSSVPHYCFNKVKSSEMTHCTCDVSDPPPKSKLGMPKFDFHQKPMMHDLLKRAKILLKMPIWTMWATHQIFVVDAKVLHY